MFELLKQQIKLCSYISYSAPFHQHIMQEARQAATRLRSSIHTGLTAVKKHVKNPQEKDSYARAPTLTSSHTPSLTDTHTYKHHSVWPDRLSAHQKPPLSFDNPCPAASTGGCLSNKSCPTAGTPSWGQKAEQCPLSWKRHAHPGSSNEIHVFNCYSKILTPPTFFFLSFASSDISCCWKVCFYERILKLNILSSGLGISHSKTQQQDISDERLTFLYKTSQIKGPAFLDGPWIVATFVFSNISWLGQPFWIGLAPKVHCRDLST